MPVFDSLSRIFSVLLVVEGGIGTLDTVKQAILLRTPVLVIDGSGRYSDVINSDVGIIWTRCWSLLASSKRGSTVTCRYIKLLDGACFVLIGALPTGWCQHWGCRCADALAYAWRFLHSQDPVARNLTLSGTATSTSFRYQCGDMSYASLSSTPPPHTTDGVPSLVHKVVPMLKDADWCLESNIVPGSPVLIGLRQRIRKMLHDSTPETLDKKQQEVTVGSGPWAVTVHRDCMLGVSGSVVCDCVL